jgi:cytochrome c
MRALVLTAALLLSPAGAFAADGDAAAGAKLFPGRCSACHSMDPAQKKPGPSLKGIVGRKAATAEGFKYSKAMTDSGLTWDEATLDKYLAAPAKSVPGTSMMIGVPGEKDRADLVAWLKTQ